MQLVLSIIFLIYAVLSWLAVMAFFAEGIPIGFLFLSFAIWAFAQWWYKKTIPFSVAAWLFLLPLSGLLLFGTLFFNQFTGGNVVDRLPTVVLLLPWLLILGVPLMALVYFFRKVQKLEATDSPGKGLIYVAVVVTAIIGTLIAYRSWQLYQEEAEQKHRRQQEIEEKLRNDSLPSR